MSTDAQQAGRAMRRQVVALLAALLPGLLPAQSQLPQLGDGQDLSYAQERRIGDRIARELYRDRDYLDDPVLGDYVAGIWARLLTAAKRRGDLPPEMDAQYAWQVTLGRDARVNAFALPGGYLGVHLGLIGVVDTEDELAAVLAHELTHVTQRHIARMVGRQHAQAPWVMGALILGMLAASRNPDAAGAMIVGGQAVAAQGALNFSRDMEREADRVGYGVLVEAGYNPAGADAMFEKLQQASRHSDSGNFPYLRSHPLTSERIADMAARQLGGEARRSLRGSRVHALMAARARVLMEDAQGNWRRHLQAVEQTPTGADDAMRRSARLYAACLAAMKLREHQRAAGLLMTLRQSVAGDAAARQQVERLAAELALARGGAAEALLLLRASGAAEPGSRADMLLQVRAQTGAGQAAQAAATLQAWLLTHAQDATAWEHLAAAYEAQGRRVPTVRAQGEAHAARYDYSGAYDRFKAAQALSRQAGVVTDNVEASIVDTRARQLESLLREQALER